MADSVAQSDRLRGLLLELDSPGALITAAEKVRDAGYRKWDTHSPFPVHGIDAAMGVRMTRLPWIVFGLGCCGLVAGLLLQWWTNATGADDFGFVPTFVQGYNYIISGKPEFSLPANIPIIFETTVLLAAFGAVFGMLAMNNLPQHSNALFNSERFKRVTTDRFFVAIDARDPRFDATQTAAFLETLDGVAVERIEEDDSPTDFPQWMKITGLVLICLALFPPLFVLKARVSKSTEPRIHIIQDMDNQERFKSQQAHPLFADGRAMRPQIAGTVARDDFAVAASEQPSGLIDVDWAAHAAYTTGKPLGGDPNDWVTGYPEQVAINETFIQRGRERFNIYCAPCHGLSGAGDGIVSVRAIALDTAGWIQPTSMHDQIVQDRPNGHIYNTISKGIRSMPPYGDQIPPDDRWAIVAYIRALQFSQKAPADEVPPALLPEKR